MQDYLKFQIGTALVKDGVCKLPYASIIEALTPAYFPEHYRFGGVAHPGTSPGKIFGPTMYVAVDVGVYNGFSNHSVGMNEVALFTSSDGGVWDKWVVVSDCCDDINYPVEPTPPTPGPDLSEPFTIEAKENNTPILAMSQSGEKTLLYSLDNGATWESATIGEGETPATLATLNASETIQFKGDNFCPGGMIAAAGMSGGGAPTFKPFYTYGNIMSLLSADNYESLDEVPEGAFESFFAASLVDIKPNHRLLLPATTLAQSCYYAMFSGCTSLTTAPELPATTLAEGCYQSMFSGCTGLTTAPELPATTLAQSCYYAMFSGCTSLTTAPELPATTLVGYCYTAMFSGCTSLTTAPELPATTLAQSCYGGKYVGEGMFEGCTALTSAPELPATTLAQDCYGRMFSGCTSLTSAPELPATTLAGRCYIEMFSGCTSLTTAPELPATTLTNTCYSGMFEGCTSLTSAPELPATTLTEGCYHRMFRGCSALNSIKCLAGQVSPASAIEEWLKDVAATGTFTKKTGVTWPIDSLSGSGIPSGWSVVEV